MADDGGCFLQCGKVGVVPCPKCHTLLCKPCFDQFCSKTLEHRSDWSCMQCQHVYTDEFLKEHFGTKSTQNRPGSSFRALREGKMKAYLDPLLPELQGIACTYARVSRETSSLAACESALADAKAKHAALTLRAELAALLLADLRRTASDVARLTADAGGDNALDVAVYDLVPDLPSHAACQRLRVTVELGRAGRGGVAAMRALVAESRAAAARLGTHVTFLGDALKKIARRGGGGGVCKDTKSRYEALVHARTQLGLPPQPGTARAPAAEAAAEAAARAAHAQPQALPPAPPAFRCSKAECRGLVMSDSSRCGMCEAAYCLACECGLALADGPSAGPHRCDADVLESVRNIRATTKPCPHCGARIGRDSGCDHMFCTNPSCCKSFSWATLEKMDSAHGNPHYDEWARKRRSLGLTDGADLGGGGGGGGRTRTRAPTCAGGVPRLPAAHALHGVLAAAQAALADLRAAGGKDRTGYLASRELICCRMLAGELSEAEYVARGFNLEEKHRFDCDNNEIAQAAYRAVLDVLTDADAPDVAEQLGELARTFNGALDRLAERDGKCSHVISDSWKLGKRAGVRGRALQPKESRGGGAEDGDRVPRKARRRNSSAEAGPSAPQPRPRRRSAAASDEQDDDVIIISSDDDDM